MSLLLPQYTCRKGSCISWLKEVWWKVHRNSHSLECFVHQCTSLADVSLFYDMTLNTRGAMTKWGFFCQSFMQCLSKFTSQYSRSATLLPPTGTACSPDANIAAENQAGWIQHTFLQPPDQRLSADSTHPFAELQDHRSQSTTKTPEWVEQLASKHRIRER